jgi:hypothetical protein
MAPGAQAPHDRTRTAARGDKPHAAESCEDTALTAAGRVLLAHAVATLCRSAPGLLYDF